MTQPFPDLFNKPQFEQCNRLPERIQQIVFYNSTRTQNIDANDTPVPNK